MLSYKDAGIGLLLNTKVVLRTKAVQECKVRVPVLSSFWVKRNNILIKKKVYENFLCKRTHKVERFRQNGEPESRGVSVRVVRSQVLVVIAEQVRLQFQLLRGALDVLAERRRQRGFDAKGE